MIAFPDASASSDANDRLLWCVGVPIADAIYLFRDAIRTASTASDAAEVATLDDARQDTNVLRRARLPGRFDYPVQTKDLDRAIALIDIEPFALSRTMKALEERLTGEYRMNLATDVDRIAADLKSIDSRLAVSLWSLPCACSSLQPRCSEPHRRSFTFSLNYMTEYGAYLKREYCQQARMAHFRGEFEAHSMPKPPT